MTQIMGISIIVIELKLVYIIMISFAFLTAKLYFDYFYLFLISLPDSRVSFFSHQQLLWMIYKMLIIIWYIREKKGSRSEFQCPHTSSPWLIAKSLLVLLLTLLPSSGPHSYPAPYKASEHYSVPCGFSSEY